MTFYPIQAVRAHFERYRTMAPWPFLWRITLEGLIASAVITVTVSSIFQLESRQDVLLQPTARQPAPHIAQDGVQPESDTGTSHQAVGNGQSLLRQMTIGVVAAPLLETLLFQTFIVALCRKWKLSFRWSMLVTGIPFALVHFLVSVGVGLGAGLVGGFYFAFTYLHWRDRSLRSAYWITTASHAIHNLVLLGLVDFAQARMSHREVQTEAAAVQPAVVHRSLPET